jgi:lysophospholipid acyltransferase (LPLAT)-like uncharacterized protein
MRSKAVQASLGWLLAAYMVIIKHTTRWTVERDDIAANVIGNVKGIIALTWHSRFLMLNSAWKKSFQPPHVLISRSHDGALVAYTARFLGLKTIRGSSRKVGSNTSKGGSSALRGRKAALDGGACIVITPDGPRGPRQRLGQGPLRLAKMTGHPILPCTFSVKNRVAFKSWDRFILPLPFGRGRIVWGTPVTIPEDATDHDIEKIRQDIETEMNILLRKADQALGHAAIEPQTQTQIQAAK